MYKWKQELPATWMMRRQLAKIMALEIHHGTFFCFTNNNKTAVWLETGNSHPNLQTPDMQFIGNADASLTVIIFRKFKLISKSLIITCQDATYTRPDAFTSKHVCEEGGDDKNVPKRDQNSSFWAIDIKYVFLFRIFLILTSNTLSYI